MSDLMDFVTGHKS